MGRIVVTEFISLDGVMEAPGGGEDFQRGGWTLEIDQGEDGAKFKLDETMDSAALLLGRVTYEGFADAWPEREAAGEEDAAIAKTLGDVRKIVVSHQDLEFTWRNSEVLKGDLIEGIRALKEEGEGTIGMSGSVSIVRQLLSAGLLDELHLLVHPIAVRSGLRLFDEGEALPLKLLSSETFETGVLSLVYGPDEAREGGYEEAKQHIAKD
jgi:dihydrofolate reductase